MGQRLWFGWVVLCCMAGCSEDTGNGGEPLLQNPAPPSANAASGALPCAVASVLEQHCVGCHGETPRLGAPIPLVQPADFLVDRGGITAGQSAVLRMQTPARPMPPPTQAPMPATDIATLSNWINAGATADPAGCAVNDPNPTVVAPPPDTGIVTAGGESMPPVAMPPVTAPMVDPPPANETPVGWRQFGSDLLNNRSNDAETVITPATAPNLRRLWQHDGAGTTSTPAVVDGVVYLPGWDGNVHALRADDGAPIWSTPIGQLVDSSALVTKDLVYVADDAGSVHALDRMTGAVRWTKKVDPHPEAHLWSSPVHIPEEDLIVVGVASSEEMLPPGAYTFRGSVVALDAASGDVRWQFYTTDNDAQSGAGVAVWGTAAVDTQRGALYVGTGNNYSEPTGPLADSMLAIDYRTGQLLWSTQFTTADVYVVFGGTGPDFDIGSSANLFSAEGKDFVGIGVKNGIYYALDRDTGAIQWMTQVSAGSVLGGVISASAHADGRIFIATNTSLMGATDTVALDAASGAELWRHSSPAPSYAGVAHAGGVVFVGTTGGALHALDATSGTELFNDMLPDSIAGGPSVADGMLFVPWGYQWTLRDGMPGTGGMIVYGP